MIHGAYFGICWHGLYGLFHDGCYIRNYIFENEYIIKKDQDYVKRSLGHTYSHRSHCKYCDFICEKKLTVIIGQIKTRKYLL